MLRSYKPVRSKEEPLTERKADWYLGLPELPGERPLNDARHAAELSREMESGEFLPETVTMATVEIDGVTYKLNGQHTAAARKMFNGSHDYPVRWVHYRVPSVIDAARLYMKYDPKLATRSYHHLFQAFNANVGMFSQIQMKVLKLAAIAIAFDKGGRTETGKRNLPGQARIELPAQHTTEVELMADIVPTPRDARHLMREPVFCAIYQTILINQRSARQFWVAVRDGENMPKADPRKRLEVYLRENSYAQGRGGAVARTRKATFHEMYSKCIHAWNAWRENYSTDLKVYKEAPLPVAR
jgi:hypothetical protein